MVTKEYGVRDDWDGLIETFSLLEDAVKYYESVKDEKMSEGVAFDESFVSIVETEDDFETETVVKKVIAVFDEELTNEIGTPKQNGYAWDNWAKWVEVVGYY